MSDCKHEFIAVDKPNRYTFWMCKHCEMELPRDHYEALQQARREGWEQCHKETMNKVYAEGSVSCNYCSDIADAIAAMEYGGEK